LADGLDDLLGILNVVPCKKRVFLALSVYINRECARPPSVSAVLDSLTLAVISWRQILHGDLLRGSRDGWRWVSAGRLALFRDLWWAGREIRRALVFEAENRVRQARQRVRAARDRAKVRFDLDA